MIQLKPFICLDKKPERLIHLHIPRTGGTTFREILADQFGREAICVIQEPWDFGEHSSRNLLIRNKNHDYWNNRETFFRKWKKAKFPRSDIYHGHLPLWLYPNHALKNATVVTWLRNPIDLVISWFRWERGCKIPDRARSMNQFVNERPRQNVMTEMLTDRENRNIVIYYGLTEFYQQDISTLARIFEWPPFSYSHHLGQPVTNELMNYLQNEKLLRRISEINESDWTLYNHAILGRFNENGSLLSRSIPGHSPLDTAS
jgi:hypothetical protein